MSEHIWCEDFLVRSFYLKNLQTNETRTVTQFHFLSWMDRGIPNSARTLLDFRRYGAAPLSRPPPVLLFNSSSFSSSRTVLLLLFPFNLGLSPLTFLQHMRCRTAWLGFGRTDRVNSRRRLKEGVSGGGGGGGGREH